MTRKRQIKLISFAILLIIAVIIVAQNLQNVTVDILFFKEIQAPFAVLLLSALAIGFAGGLIVASSRRKK
jgi:uncharacterized integral membrane protein